MSFKKSLKIPKGQSESVYRIRTDNTMAKRKSIKGQTTIYKTHITLTLTWTPLKTGGGLMCSGRVSSSFSTSGTRRITLVKSPVISHEWEKDREVFTSGDLCWSHLSHWTWNISIVCDQGYSLSAIVTIASFFLLYWPITCFLTIFTWQVPLAEQGLFSFRNPQVDPQFLEGFMLLKM